MFRIVSQIGFIAMASWAALSAAQAQPAQHFYVVSVGFGIAPENFERAKQIMDENAKASISDETGCRQFDVYEVATVPNHLFLYELYDDEAAFQQHLASAHYKHFNETFMPLVTARAGARGTTFVTYRKPQ